MLPPHLRSTLVPYTTLFRSRKPDARNSKTNEAHVRAHEPRAITNNTVGVSSTARRKRKQDDCVVGDCPRLVCSRSEEHTSELQSLRHLVCRLLLVKQMTHHD